MSVDDFFRRPRNGSHSQITVPNGEGVLSLTLLVILIGRLPINANHGKGKCHERGSSHGKSHHRGQTWEATD